jgi:hypothetical protein
VDRVVGLEGVRVEVAMLETPDGQGRLELMRFHAPPARGGDPDAPANTLGAAGSPWGWMTWMPPWLGCGLVGWGWLGVERYQDRYRLCHVRGSEGIIVMLAEQLG